MSTIMTRNAAPVTASSGEPEPRHDRAGTPTAPTRPRNRIVIRNNDACGLCGFWTCRCNGVTAHDDSGDSGQADEALRRIRTGR